VSDDDKKRDEQMTVQMLYISIYIYDSSPAFYLCSFFRFFFRLLAVLYYFDENSMRAFMHAYIYIHLDSMNNERKDDDIVSE